jgi:hypothetical protein
LRWGSIAFGRWRTVRVTAPAHPCARGISASLHVIACIEEPALIARILGHVQQRLESDNQPARAPPGHQEQPFNLM